MAKSTLLDIVQDILSDGDGDEVNNISDTVESMQCAKIVVDEFATIVDEFDVKMHETLKQLEATGATTPSVMTRPEGFHSIDSIYYDKRVLAGDPARFQQVWYKEPEAFLKTSMQLTSSDSEVESLTLGNSGHSFLIRNDQAPTYWTILEGYDDIVFDSYDSALETNLQASKSLARGVERAVLALTNSAVPDLPENLMLLLKNRARAMYFELFKDGSPNGVARRERYSEVRAQRKKYVTRKLQQSRTGPNYGRKS